LDQRGFEGRAYANAICNAIGTWIHEFPMTPEVVLEAIEKKKAQS
jgi:CO/xanthine dehydrogenase Mo-binding subunit